MINSLKIALAGVILLGLVDFGYATGVELRYIRIGEHKDYTRIVFEFRGTPAYKPPVVTDKGTFTLTFPNATTALPSKIVTETSKRVDTMTFLQQPSGLKADVTLAFSYFKVKAFTLANPDRVVLDISRLNQPPEGFLSAKNATTPAPVEPAARSRTGSEVQLQKTESKKSVTPKPKQPGAATRPAAPPEASKQALSTQPRGQGPTPARGQTPSSLTTVSGAGTRTERSPESVSPQKARPASMAAPPGVDQTTASRPPGATGGHLQTILLVALLALSLIMVGLLAFIVFRRRREAATIQPEHPLEAAITADDDIADIDAQIKKRLEKLD
ncbi:MAG: hypothetical protein JRI36_06850 [Deltaproteobacteria bacterium]|nr:hypothetical protein [Deltaproteobacteria bacterium]